MHGTRGLAAGGVRAQVLDFDRQVVRLAHPQVGARPAAGRALEDDGSRRQRPRRLQAQGQAEVDRVLGRRKQARTPLPWRALEQVPDFLRGRGWVPIGSSYSTDGTPGSLDAHLKTFLKTATAGWIAVVLEKAGVITVDRTRPARIKLRPGW